MSVAPGKWQESMRPSRSKAEAMNATSTNHHCGGGFATRSFALLAASLLWAYARVSFAQPLASWNDGPPKQAIVKFVTDVATQGAPTQFQNRRIRQGVGRSAGEMLDCRRHEARLENGFRVPVVGAPYVKGDCNGEIDQTQHPRHLG